MSPFPDRLAALEQLLASRHSAGDGGWPQKLGMANGATTITATAQALEILRIRGLEYRDPAIQSGLRYLAVQVREHNRAGARGEWNRFPAYALWGLMRYPAALKDPQFDDGIQFSYSALRRFSLPAGGWSQSRRDGPIWLPVTMVAVHALDRLGLYTGRQTSEQMHRMTHQARDHVMSEGRNHNRNQLYWNQTPGGEPCPGTTCLAILTLARGTSEQRDAARAGINWLTANHQEWINKIHVDDQVDTRVWRILSFSLGLRALLHPCSPCDANDPAVMAAVQHIDMLWNEEEQGWADRPGLEASTSGSYAVVSAVHTLKKAWPFDPFRDLGIPAQRRAGPPISPPRANRILFVITSERRIRVDDQFQDTLLEAKISGDSQWPLLNALAKRHHKAEARSSTDLADRTVSLDELAQLGNGDKPVKPESVIKTLRRLQKKLAADAKAYTKYPFRDLIEDHIPPGTTERRFVLEEIEVRLVDKFPEPSGDAAQ